jgi:hypothetical protein
MNLASRTEAPRYFALRLMRLAGDDNFAGRAAQELRTRNLFDQIGIDGTGLEQLNAMFETPAVVAQRSQLILDYGEPRLRIGQGEQTAATPNGVVTEIHHRRAANRRYHKSAKKPCHAVTDSHVPNES